MRAFREQGYTFFAPVRWLVSFPSLAMWRYFGLVCLPEDEASSDTQSNGRRATSGGADDDPIRKMVRNDFNKDERAV